MGSVTAWPKPCSDRKAWPGIALCRFTAPFPKKIHFRSTFAQVTRPLAPEFAPLENARVVLELEDSGLTDSFGRASATGVEGWDIAFEFSRYEDPLPPNTCPLGATPVGVDFSHFVHSSGAFLEFYPAGTVDPGAAAYGIACGPMNLFVGQPFTELVGARMGISASSYALNDPVVTGQAMLFNGHSTDTPVGILT